MVPRRQSVSRKLPPTHPPTPNSPHFVSVMIRFNLPHLLHLHTYPEYYYVFILCMNTPWTFARNAHKFNLLLTKVSWGTLWRDKPSANTPINIRWPSVDFLHRVFVGTVQIDSPYASHIVILILKKKTKKKETKFNVCIQFSAPHHKFELAVRGNRIVVVTFIWPYSQTKFCLRFIHEYFVFWITVECMTFQKYTLCTRDMLKRHLEWRVVSSQAKRWIWNYPTTRKLNFLFILIKLS